MKILYKTMRLWLLAVCLCTLAATPASAKVCFVGEENCTGGGSFDDYKDPGEDGNLCKKEGFGTTAAECRNDPNKDITAYCPYNNNYVKCCGKEYVYDAPCVYPLVTKGKCGNKYKCECDSSQYKYTDHECKTIKGAAGEGYENSYGSGSFCTQQSYDSNTQKIVSEVRYSSCQCDRGIYPKFGSSVPNDPNRKSDCDYNAEKQGPCSTKYATGNKTETYYKFCRCNTKDYPETDSGCYPLTGDASQDTCFDTIMHYRECASCGKYPARNLDHVPYSPGSKVVQCEKDDKGNLVDPDCDYEVCPYDQTGNTYFKIRKCNEPGYKAKRDGSGCEPIACKDAVKIFVKECGSSYGIFDGSNFLDANGQQSRASKAIVAGNISVSGAGTISSNTSYTRVCTSMRCASFSTPCQQYIESTVVRPSCGRGQYACCTSAYNRPNTTTAKGELGKSTALTYYSPSYAATGNSDGAKAIKVACANTNPTITYTGSAFPTTSTKEMILYGLNLKFSAQSTSLSRPLTIYNGTVTVNTLNVYSDLALNKSTSKPNATNAKVKGGNLNFYGSSELNTSSYDFEIGDIFFNNGTGNSNNRRYNYIMYPNSFVANKLYTRGGYTNVILYGGKYYIVRTEAGWSKEKDYNYVYLQGNAVYYMYSSRSNDHVISAMGCGAFRVQTGSVVQAQTWARTNASWKSCRYGSKQGKHVSSNGNQGGDCGEGTCWCGYDNGRCGKKDDCC